MSVSGISSGVTLPLIDKAATGSQPAPALKPPGGSDSDGDGDKSMPTSGASSTGKLINLSA